ncbi:hypothetical protein AX16_008554 [Volvariella volvacea WC 439]|nr:hypothetical protein AX16_008554 [Volvariella volvacea WC 439]
MSDLPHTDVAIPTPLTIPTSSFDADYTPETVPQDIKEKVVENGILFVDVVNAGAKRSSRLDDEEASNRGQIKNHVTFRVHVNLGQGDNKKLGLIRFGMDTVSEDEIGSNQGQYVGSSRSDPQSGSDVVYSPISPVSKPADQRSDEGVPAALPLVPATGEGSHDSYGTGLAVFSDFGSANKPADIASSFGDFFQQPTEGAPHPGVFNIKVRGRTEPSRSIVIVFNLRLRAGITFGELLAALVERNIEPFRFRKINFAYLGCRDFVSQAVSIWIRVNFLVSDQATIMFTDPDTENDIQFNDYHIYDLLCWRYSRPLVPTHIPDETRRAARRIRNLIDRAIWPANFVHFEHEKLMYNQVIEHNQAVEHSA